MSRMYVSCDHKYIESGVYQKSEHKIIIGCNKYIVVVHHTYNKIKGYGIYVPLLKNLYGYKFIMILDNLSINCIRKTISYVYRILELNAPLSVFMNAIKGRNVEVY